MTMKLFIVLLVAFLGGCSTYNVTVSSRGAATVTINGSKDISTLPVRAEGNTIPLIP